MPWLYDIIIWIWYRAVPLLMMMMMWIQDIRVPMCNLEYTALNDGDVVLEQHYFLWLGRIA